MLSGVARSILSVLQKRRQRGCFFSFVTCPFDVFKLCRQFHCVSHAGHGTCFHTRHRDSVRALGEVGPQPHVGRGIATTLGVFSRCLLTTSCKLKLFRIVNW